MLTVYHRNNSRAQRILWLLEELAVPYGLKTCQRDVATSLAPSALKKAHPLGKAPMAEDEGRLIVESAAIVGYLCARHDPHLIPPAGSGAHIDHLALMHFA
ncbi:glutathione S-transferase N-terminal domain-containing protein [Pikeienuella piscinae]|uniref:glutathione S-transferase N-terminal domain-containing protein n=1 Tax=Pikeienuella piscinae TaxID=2748098 RepID=UPI001FE7FCB0|nr:glutathione S-transferase N-terminal domain-containing protein [Pikeienuella piscinae]